MDELSKELKARERAVAEGSKAEIARHNNYFVFREPVLFLWSVTFA